MPTLTKLYTMQEAAQHNTPQDCWVVIDGKVYDVGSYLDEHPGGDDVILATTGKDATDEFEDAGHSKSARELLETFFIGELDLSATVIPELEISSKKQTVFDKAILGSFCSHCWRISGGWLHALTQEVEELILFYPGCRESILYQILNN